MPDDLVEPTRRACLGLLAGAAGAASGSPVLAAAPLDMQDPQRRLETYVRLRARLDGRKTFMPYRGTIFGKPEGKIATPLFDVEGFSWTRALKLNDDRYRLDSVEAGYFLDRSSGQPLDRWTNPLNGLETRVEHYRSWSHLIAGPDGIQPVFDGSLGPNTVFTASAGRPSVMGGKVWMHEDLLVQMPNRPRERFSDPLEYVGPTVTATSLATWSADLADCSNTALLFVPTLLSYQTLGSWRPFMRMGQAPGVVSWRMFGVKAAVLEEVPGHLRQRALSDYPDFLTKESVGASAHGN